MVDYKERIESKYSVMLGKPCIKDTRITVEAILRKMSEGAGVNNILEIYPQLSDKDVFACLLYAVDVISREEIIDINKAS